MSLENRFYKSIEIVVIKLAEDTLESLEVVGGIFTREEFGIRFDKGPQREFFRTLSNISNERNVIGFGLDLDFDKYVDQLFDIYSSARENYPISISPVITNRKYDFDFKRLLKGLR